MPREPRSYNALFEGADQQRPRAVRIEVRPSGIVERLPGQVSVKLVIGPQFADRRRPDRGRLIVTDHDPARSNRLRQSAAVAGHGGNAAELRFRDNAAPGLGWARREQDPGVAIDGPHVSGAAAQPDVSE